VRVRFERTDPDIAEDAARVLALRGDVPEGVQAAVHRGHVALTGTVTWPFQKDAAEAAVRHVRGLHGIHNHIVVTPLAAGHDVEKRIIKAMHREADVDARRLTATVADGVVTLEGVVTTWLQRQSAERAAASAPGVARVVNRVVVEPAISRQPDDVDEFC
jgi:osmotically-inducible protein OsmY